MGGLSPLAMSQTKDQLISYLELPLETYNRMAKETELVYRWLTTDRQHLKKNCKKTEPPYDWSDVLEKSKDVAIECIATSNDTQTSYYWNLSTPTFDCPNWIARWFLYHKFRYRDGRNRNHGSSRKTLAERSSRNRHSTSGRQKRGELRPRHERGHEGYDEGMTVRNGRSKDIEPMYTTTSYSPQADSMCLGPAAIPTNNSYVEDVNTQLHYEDSASQVYKASYGGKSSDAESDDSIRIMNEYWDPVRDAKSNSSGVHQPILFARVLGPRKAG